MKRIKYIHLYNITFSRILLWIGWEKSQKKIRSHLKKSIKQFLLNSLSLNSCAHTHVANSVTSNVPYDNDHI